MAKVGDTAPCMGLASVHDRSIGPCDAVPVGGAQATRTNKFRERKRHECKARRGKLRRKDCVDAKHDRRATAIDRIRKEEENRLAAVVQRRAEEQRQKRLRAAKPAVRSNNKGCARYDR